MNRPWMPFYIADYLGDTGHLSTTQHGAYILLICHYWRTGGLPEDDAKLAKITRLSLKSWTDLVRPDIEPLFLPGWKHKRVEKELAKQEIIAVRRAMAGAKGGAVTASSRINQKRLRGDYAARVQANAEQMPATIKQLPSKGVAVTPTCLSSIESERETEPQKEATEEARKRPDQWSRLDFETVLAAKRKA